MERTYRLEDTTEPNLIEDVFPYSLPPLIRFDGAWSENIDGKTVSFDPSVRAKADIHVTDTTFRDGQQARPPYTVEQQVKLFKMLSELGGPNGVIRQTEFFLYTKNDRAALDEIARRVLGAGLERIESALA